MATFKYFADLNGAAFELTSIWPAGVDAKFGNVRTGKTADGLRVAVSRAIEMKRAPSRHVCDARCVHASGKVMRCECACGGANHGRGA